MCRHALHYHVGVDVYLPLRQALAPLPAATRGWLRRVIRAAEHAGVPLYLVGGYVRDRLLERPSLDLDLVLEGDAIAFGRRVQRALGGALTVHKAFGTAVWQLPAQRGLPVFVDLISARREQYAHPGALPTVEFAPLVEDQFRRDFTINTLALRLDGPHAGQILDAWGGLADLRAGVIRVLHEHSFSDDPTRILRALRFSGRLGFALERQTRRQLRANLPQLEAVSGERIYKELELILLEPQREAMLLALRRYKVLAAISPGLRFDARRAAGLARSRPPEPEWELSTTPAQLGFTLWFAQLRPAAAMAAATRLRFSSSVTEAVLAATRLQAQAARLAALPVSAFTQYMDSMPRLALYSAYVLQPRGRYRNRLLRYVKEWRHVQPYTRGAELLRRGLTPGPAYKSILYQLRAAWLDGKLKTQAQEQALLAQLLAQQSGAGDEQH